MLLDSVFGWLFAGKYVLGVNEIFMHYSKREISRADCVILVR
jgi:hypothetical protein